MDELLQAIAELAVKLHPDHIESIALKITSIKSVDEFVKVKAALGPNMDRSLVDGLDRAWRKYKATRPNEVAATLRGASASASLLERSGSVNLVWTGPSTGLVPTRHTEQVLLEVIESAEKRLFLVSFVAYEVDSIMKALNCALERQVGIDILLESSIEHGGKVSVDSVKMMKELLPSATVHVWKDDPKKSDTVKPGGAVHAKCVVADGNIAFITSANLSGAAMERNMELGVLLKGGDLPSVLHRHLDALVKTKIIEPV